MDKHQYDAQPQSGRRKFLRQLGMTAAATAALSGLADVAGLRPAAAATRAAGGMKVRGARNRASSVTVVSAFFGCSLCSGCCGGPCTPSGVYCHFCAGGTLMSNGDTVDTFSGYYCIGGDNNFTLS
jgi:hypothetical protein